MSKVISDDGRWAIEAEQRGDLLLLRVSSTTGEQFCSESVQAHLSPDRLSFMIAAFKKGGGDCALPDVHHADEGQIAAPTMREVWGTEF